MNENAAHINPWTMNMVKSGLESEQLSWVIELDGFNVGHLVVLPILDVWELLNIAVHPDYHGLGLGVQCLNYLFVEAKAKSINSLLLEVRESNSIALKLYCRYGFSEIGRRKNYYQRGESKEDALVMQVELPKKAV